MQVNVVSGCGLRSRAHPAQHPPRSTGLSTCTRTGSPASGGSYALDQGMPQIFIDRYPTCASRCLAFWLPPEGGPRCRGWSWWY
jgi:hypothetical protein